MPFFVGQYSQVHIRKVINNDLRLQSNTEPSMDY